MWIKSALLNLGILIAGMAATPELKITSPPEGTVVAPGGVLIVTVEATPFAFQSVLIAGKPIGLSDAAVTPPYRFAVQISPDTPAGTETLEALGVIEPGKWIPSPSLTIDVERPDSPRSLTTVLHSFSFDRVGEDCGIQLDGVFADGSSINLTHSTFTKYVSDLPSVATVNADGVVTAVGVGHGGITIRHRNLRFSVGVTVAPPVSISPDWAVAHASATNQFYAHVENGSREASVTWSLGAGDPGSIDQEGNYTAPSSIDRLQIVTVTATDKLHNTHRASVKVWLYPPATLSLTPKAISLGPSETHAFSAQVTNPPNALVLWSLEPANAGTLDRRGFYTAPDSIASPRTVTVTAQAMTEPPLTATATISLKPASSK